MTIIPHYKPLAFTSFINEVKAQAAAVMLTAAAVTASAEVTLPVPPASMREPAERAAFIAVRFWDTLDFASLPAGTETIEQDFVNFLSISAIAPADSARKAIGIAAQRIAPSGRTADFADLSAKYLLGEGSPLRDDALFITVADSLLHYGGMNVADSMRVAFMRNEAAKALPGTEAPAIKGTTDTGREFDLADTAGKMRLIMFYDPDCDTCHATLRQLKADAGVNGAIASGRLEIIAVYADDDTEAWGRSRGTVPEGWTNVNAPDAGELYSIPSMPTLYLLDPASIVILKEATPEAVAAAVK